ERVGREGAAWAKDAEADRLPAPTRACGPEQRRRAVAPSVVRDDQLEPSLLPVVGERTNELVEIVGECQGPQHKLSGRGEGAAERDALERGAARLLPRDAPDPSVRGEGRGAFPRRRPTGVPPRGNRTGGRRRWRLPCSRGRRRDCVDAPRARSHPREGNVAERADGGAVREARR